jgi:hypothetical protein
MACIGRQDPGPDARSFRVPDLLKRDLRLGFKNKVLRNPRLRAALCITGSASLAQTSGPNLWPKPLAYDLWPIKPICDRQARPVIGD